jgi:hypothetical protein
MDDKATFAELLLVRNIRADGLGRQLAALRLRLSDMEAEAEALASQIGQAAERVVSASPTQLMRPGRLVGGLELQEQALKAVTAKAALERLEQSSLSMGAELARLRQSAEEWTERLTRSVHIVRRTECVLEMLREEGSEEEGPGSPYS